MRSGSIVFFVSAIGTAAGSPWPQSAYTRADQTLAQLTQAEKVALCSGNNANYDKGQDYVGFIQGACCRSSAACAQPLRLGERTVPLVSYVDTAGIPRLGIPPINLEDGPQGVADGMQGVTAWPSIMTVSQAWDTALMLELAVAMGAEEKAKGANIQLGPAVALVRCPLSGRNFEYISEDPVLNAAMATQLVLGIQSNNISASVKHFIFNSQEYERQGGPNTTSYSAAVGERAAFELYTPPYAAAVAAGVGTVMCR
jgi:beta-glucosidase-like glycosyl hydrolase